MLGPPVGGLAPREANGDQDRAASSHRDAPSRGERGRRPRHRPERGSVGDRRGGDPRQPRGYTWVGWLPRLSGVRQARPPQPRTLRLSVPHRPLRRARTPRRSRLGLPSRTVPPTSHHAGSSRSGPGAGSPPSRWDRAPVRVHRRCMSAAPAPELNCCSAFPCPNAGEPLASESTRRESPIVPECSRSCQDVSTSADAAATGAKNTPQRLESPLRASPSLRRPAGTPCPPTTA